MKVIDLLNKIANSEEVPNKIKFHNNIFIFDKSDMTYYLENSDKNLFSICNYKILSDEVEIIEEKPKKIEKIQLKNECIIDCDETGKHFIKTNRKDRNIYITKINEIIDNLNYLLEKSDSE